MHRPLCRTADNFDDLFRRGRILLSKLERAIHVGMRYGTTGIRLERQPRRFPDLAKFEQLLETVFRGPAERMEKPVSAFKNSFRTAKPFASQQSGDHATMSRPTGMHSFCPGTVG